MTPDSTPTFPPRPAWALGLFRWVARRKLGLLDGVYVRGLPELRAALEEGPVILALTHASWWDILLLLHLDATLGVESRAAMDAKNLKKLPYFGLVGAVPLDRSDRAQAQADLQRMARWLDRPRRLLFIYPQGRHRPTGIRPLGLRPGVQVLAGHAGVRVVPAAVQYGFREAEQVTAVLTVSPPLPTPSDVQGDWLAALETALVGGLAAGDQFLDAGDPSYTLWVASRQHVQQDGLAARILGQFVRFVYRRPHG